MNKRMKLCFERGGELEVVLLSNAAPKTIEIIGRLLPLTNMAYHSRWSGREVNTEIRTRTQVPRENQTIQTAPGDVIYWREWERQDEDVSEAIAVYYGPELTRYHKGPQLVNVFGRVAPEQWGLIEEIGLRIWRQGGERITIRW